MSVVYDCVGRCTVVYSCVRMYMVVYGGVRWCTKLYGDVRRYTVVYGGVQFIRMSTVAYGSVCMCTEVYSVVLWCTVMYVGVQWYTVAEGVKSQCTVMFVNDNMFIFYDQSTHLLGHVVFLSAPCSSDTGSTCIVGSTKPFTTRNQCVQCDDFYCVEILGNPKSEAPQNQRVRLSQISVQCQCQ